MDGITESRTLSGVVLATLGAAGYAVFRVGIMTTRERLAYFIHIHTYVVRVKYICTAGIGENVLIIYNTYLYIYYNCHLLSRLCSAR